MVMDTEAGCNVFFVHAALLYLLSLQLGQCCSRGLQADSVLPTTRTTRYEMVGAFSRPLTPDEQSSLKDEIQQLAQGSIPSNPNRRVSVQEPYFPTSQSVTIPFSVSGQPLSADELKMMLIPLKKLFRSEFENNRKKRDALFIGQLDVRHAGNI